MTKDRILILLDFKAPLFQLCWKMDHIVGRISSSPPSPPMYALRQVTLYCLSFWLSNVAHMANEMLANADIQKEVKALVQLD